MGSTAEDLGVTTSLRGLWYRRTGILLALRVESGDGDEFRVSFKDFRIFDPHDHGGCKALAEIG